jgi:hypothetical protein
MGMMKDYMMSLEELVWEAIEIGFQTDDEIYSYVYMSDRRAEAETVKEITRMIYIDCSGDIVYN